MGISGISPWSILLILIIIILLFGTKKLRSLGSDLGKAYNEFKNALDDKKNKNKKKK